MSNQDNVPPHEQTTQSDLFIQPTVATWPPPPRPRKPQRSGVMSMVLATIALLLIVGGLGAIVFATTAQYTKKIHTEATAQARLTANANATKLALTQQATATNQALATQQAYIYATATALIGSTATAQGSSAAATATASAAEN